jgi:hypothetical protein
MDKQLHVTADFTLLSEHALKTLRDIAERKEPLSQAEVAEIVPRLAGSIAEISASLETLVRSLPQFAASDEIDVTTAAGNPNRNKPRPH